MSEISQQDVQQIAKLARLKLSSEEERYFEKELSAVLTYFEDLDSLDLNLEEGFRPDVLGSPVPERQDEVLSSLSVEEVMRSAPAKQGTSFHVPKILE